MVIPSKVTLEGSDGSEAKLAVTVFLKAPPRWGKQRVHYICSIPSSKSIQKSSVREKNGNFLRYSNFTSGGVMSNSNLISSIELTRKNLRAQIEGLRVEAEDTLQNTGSSGRNETTKRLTLPDIAKFQRGSIWVLAPKVELIGNARKVTITWHQFSPYKTRAPSHMSKRVQPMKSGKYSKNCFVNHASWEYRNDF
ncbi:conjugative transfer protein MobI(A/C) [Escherichia coli]